MLAQRFRATNRLKHQSLQVLLVRSVLIHFRLPALLHLPVSMVAVLKMVRQALEEVAEEAFLLSLHLVVEAVVQVLHRLWVVAVAVLRCSEVAYCRRSHRKFLRLPASRR